MKNLTFQNGDKLPSIGLGTWKSQAGEVHDAVLTALKIGYRHIDCAAIYGNEAEIGQALQEAFSQGIVQRTEVWITSKLWNNAHKAADVRPALEKTLQDLQLDELDLYLVHWPVVLKPDVHYPQQGDDFLSLEEVPIEETWRTLEDCHAAGLTKHLGVSNFNAQRIEELVQYAHIAPAMNQVELHPYLQQPKLLEVCQRHNVYLTGYSPLGSTDRPERLKQENDPVLLEDETIKNIAEQHQCSVAQVLLAWAVQRGTAVIPKSTNPGRIKENLDAAAIQLTSEDMERIATLDRSHRYIHGLTWTIDGSPYTQASLWG